MDELRAQHLGGPPPARPSVLARLNDAYRAQLAGRDATR